MNNRHEEIRCYECGRLKTRPIWKSRCATCVVQRLESNLEENDTLRDENAALEVRVAELEEGIARCRQQASYCIGNEEDLKNQLSKVRDIANEVLISKGAKP